MSEFKIEDGKIIFPGSDDYWCWYDYGDILDKLFPDQEGEAFGLCIGYNDKGPVSEANAVAALVCEQAGEREGESWVWLVTMEDGTRWRLTGGCDYTGWDCRSWNEWVATT